MSITVNPTLMHEIQQYGAADILACFNCGNCTAVCPNSSEMGSFPRKVIRYGQIGLKDQILNSPEAWLCYYCGECSNTCPRQAEPGEYMASLRRYSIAHYEPTGLAKLFYKHSGIAFLVMLAVSVILGFFMVTVNTHEGETMITRWLFQYVDYFFIETLGMIVMGIAVLSMIGGLFSIVHRFMRHYKGNGSAPEVKGDPAAATVQKRSVGESIGLVAKELMFLKRFQTCDEETKMVWFLKPWFVHWTIMWGFMLLLVATMLDIPFLGLKDPNSDVWLPSRLIGIAGGLLLLYGTTIVIFRRLLKTEDHSKTSRFSDWYFIWMLWFLGASGFWLLASVYWFAPNILHQTVLLVHSVAAMMLVLLFAFTKFAHVAYRPIALFFYYRYSGI